MSDAAVHVHLEMLASCVFQTETKWPHFRLLLRNLSEWSQWLAPDATVVSLERMQRWFYGDHFPQLMEWEEAYRDNLVRKHTQFPVSFSIVARKPVV